MSTAIEIGGYGGIVPATISLVVYLLLRRCLPTAAAQRSAAAVAVGLAFFAGYALLPSWAALRPERHWQWLPYLGVGGMIVGPLAILPSVRAWQRWLLYALLAIGAAWLLTPTWASLQPPRSVWIVLLATYLWLLMAALDALPPRLHSRLLMMLLAIAAIVVAVLLAAAISLKFGQVAGIAAAAICGCCACEFLVKQPSAVRGLIPVFAMLVGGAAFVGFIEPQPPATGMLLAPAAPLMLGLFVRGPLSRLAGKRAAIAQTAAVLVPLAAALVWMLAE